MLVDVDACTQDTATTGVAAAAAVATEEAVAVAATVVEGGATVVAAVAATVGGATGDPAAAAVAATREPTRGNLKVSCRTPVFRGFRHDWCASDRGYCFSHRCRQRAILSQ